VPLVPGGLSTPGAPAVDGGGGRVAEAKVSAMVWQSSNVAVKGWVLFSGRNGSKTRRLGEEWLTR